MSTLDAVAARPGALRAPEPPARVSTCRSYYHKRVWYLLGLEHYFSCCCCCWGPRSRRLALLSNPPVAAAAEPVGPSATLSAAARRRCWIFHWRISHWNPPFQPPCRRLGGAIGPQVCRGPRRSARPVSQFRITGSRVPDTRGCRESRTLESSGDAVSPTDMLACIPNTPTGLPRPAAGVRSDDSSKLIHPLKNVYSSIRGWLNHFIDTFEDERISS